MITTLSYDYVVATFMYYYTCSKTLSGKLFLNMAKINKLYGVFKTLSSVLLSYEQ